MGVNNEIGDNLPGVGAIEERPDDGDAVDGYSSRQWRRQRRGGALTSLARPRDGRPASVASNCVRAGRK